MKVEVAFQRLEGLAILIASLITYFWLGYTWWVFVLLIFLIDITMLGYLFGKEAGAAIYNIGHSLFLPIIVLGFAIVTEASAVLGLTLIWTAHIGLDRSLGYGLKTGKGFEYTHLGKIGGKHPHEH